MDEAVIEGILETNQAIVACYAFKPHIQAYANTIRSASSSGREHVPLGRASRLEYLDNYWKNCRRRIGRV